MAAFNKTLADGRSEPVEPVVAPPATIRAEDELFEADAIDLSGCFRLKKSTKNERNDRMEIIQTNAQIEKQRVSSEMAVFARACRKFIENFPGNKQIHPIHFDTILVLIRYSCLFYNNSDFSKFLTRTIDMILTYCEYARMTNTKSDHIIATEATQLIIHKFISPTAVYLTIPSEQHSEYISEIMMKIVINILKINQNPEKINSIVSDCFSRHYYSLSSSSSFCLLSTL